MTKTVLNAQPFVFGMTQQIHQNPTIFTSIKPFLIERQIDDSELDDCTKAILNKLKNLQQQDIVKIIARFDNPESVFSVKFKQFTLPNQPNGSIRLGQTEMINNTTCDITLNSIHFNNNGSTNLIKAQVILHEMLHWIY